MDIDIKNIIKKSIKEVVFREVKDDESLLKSHLLDSMATIEFAVKLEEDFKISIGFNEINENNFETVDLLEAYIKTKII